MNMIVKNFLDVEPRLISNHGGLGLAKSAQVFEQEAFDTKLSFIHYTLLEPGVTIGYHTHGDDEEIYAILEGEGTLTVNGESRHVKTGDVIVNKPGWTHGLVNDSDKVMKIFVFKVLK
jgi:quercetin dioxygenase-like cupin family protein